MKKKYFVVFLMILASVLFLTACSRTGQNYSLVKDMSSICSIEIVHVGEISAARLTDKELEVQTTICIIEDINGFCEDFRNLDAKWSGEAVCIEDNVTAVKIIYNNGDYMLVHWLGASGYYNGFFHYDGGTNFYDEAEFNALVSKYAENR